MQEAAISIGAVALLAGLLGLYFAFRSRAEGRGRHSAAKQQPHQDAPTLAAEGPALIPDIFEVDFYRLAFHTRKENTQPNRQILNAFEAQQVNFLQDPTLLPRQPLILPKLLRAVKHESGNSNELVNIILQDPGLTADVLKMSNSPLYRNTKTAVNDLEYAVVVLGIDGLKSVICASVMRPIFDTGSANNKTLTPLMWEYGLAAAFIAQRYATKAQRTEAFSSHILTLLTCIAELVIVQAATRLFRSADLAVEPETLAHLREAHCYRFTVELMQSWALDDRLIKQLANPSHNSTSHLKTAQTLGRVLGRAVVMINHNRITKDELLTQMDSHDVDRALVEFLLTPSDRERGM